MRKLQTSGETPQENAEGISRRDFLQSSAVGLAAVAAVPGVPATLASAAGAESAVRNLEPQRKLLKGGIVLSLDPKVGDFEKADVLIEGKKIVAVGRNLGAGGQLIDATGMIVMPGFINTHHHQYYSPQRAIIADGNLSGAWPQESYGSIASNIWTTGRIGSATNPIWDLGRSPYDPEDCYIAELIASVNQINQGVTTGIDTSQSSHTPAHTDAMIQGLMDSGRRTLYAYSPGRSDQPGYEHPGTLGDMTRGLGRLKSTYFSSNDQLVTVALNTGFNAANYQLARHLGVPLVQHGGPNAAGAASGLLGPDNEYIHGTGLADQFWKVIADTGGHISIAPTIEMQMGHGIPPMQKALDFGLLPSLSSDVETNMTPDMFTLMRSAFTLQRMDIHTRIRNGENHVPPLLTCYQVIQMATIAGAVCAHVEHKVGTLTPGKEADIIMLEARGAANTAGFFNAPGAVLTLMDPSNVVNVFIAGKQMKKNGKLVGVNVARLAKDVERSRDRIFARIKSKPIPVDGLNSAPGYSPTMFRSCCVSEDYDVRP
jgi:cytosine/adenosine deaminase-related metal-dependent hydrolase